jgi:hypothetical protein
MSFSSGAPLSSDRGSILTALIITAILVLVSNIFLISIDDMSVVSKHNFLHHLLTVQETDGRYTFVALLFVLEKLNVGYDVYISISFVVFVLSLVYFYLAIIAYLDLARTATICGFVLFVSFGPWLDIYRFTDAYICYAVALFCVAGAIRVSTGSASWAARLGGSAGLSFVALGAYQTAGQLLFIAAAAYLVLPRLAGRPQETVARLERAAVLLIAAVPLGGVLYTSLNAGLKLIGIAGFQNYPGREQGVRFVASNLQNYEGTLRSLISWETNIYDPLLPPIWRVAFAGLIVWAIVELWKRRSRGWYVALLGLAIAFAVWPNPGTLVLGFYWPSPRTLSGFAPFFGGLCAVLFDLSERQAKPLPWPFNDGGRVAAGGLTGQPMVVPVGATLLWVLAACQCTLDAVRYSDRLQQQTLDFALAESIVSNAYRSFALNQPILIKLGIDGMATGAAKPPLFDYSVSLFAAPWAAPALIEHVSGNRIAAQMATPGECSSATERLTFKRLPDSLLVCLRSP